jgi:dihydrofolate reductase
MISLIWAQAANGVIGKVGSLPWSLPEDLRRFRALTMGSTVLMGRVTWDSLPAAARPLSGRRNLVLTRQPDWAADGAIRVGTVEAGIEQAAGDLWVIGGSQVYDATLVLADQVVITELDSVFEGDAYAPKLDAAWSTAECEPGQGWSESTTGLRYRVTTFKRQSD